MTAGIGVLNKQAVALAADSAVTIGNGRKVYNTANKIFSLNEKEKIGVIIYNNSSWLGIPMETIIKLYKETEGRSIKTVQGYVEDFIHFLENNIINFLTSEKIEEYLKFLLFDAIDYLIDQVNAEINYRLDEKIIEFPENDIEQRKLFESIFLMILEDEIETYEEFRESSKNNFSDLKLHEFKEISGEEIISIINGFMSQEKISKKKIVSKNLIKYLYLITVNDFRPEDDFVGLVFAGFGTEEIFPSVYEIRFSGIINKRVKYQIYRKGEIREDNSAIIAPFAQSEMASTFMEGINPEIENIIEGSVKENLYELQEEISNKFKIKQEELEELFEKKYNNIFDKIHESKHKKMVLPVIETVSIMRKEDLIEIAESLVNITSIKRKATLDIDSVGGPVDISIITKSEGFIWVKRKEKLNGF